MADNPIIEELLCDHLFLLVGANPLPDLVAARLLTKIGGTVWLLHSESDDGEPSTKDFAENTEIVLLTKRPDLTVRLEPVSSSDNLKIENRVREIIGRADGPTGKIGLNYTGGTKPMSLHAYRELERAFPHAPNKPVFSYLDPRKVALRIDGKDAQGCMIFSILNDSALRQTVEVTVDEIAALHGYERDRSKGNHGGSAQDTRNLANLINTIVDAYASPSGAEQWRKWLKEPNLETLPDIGTYSELKQVRQAMDDLCGGAGHGTPDALARCLRSHAICPDLRSCKPWLWGTWLEDYCWLCFQSTAGRFPITSSDRNMHYHARREMSDSFELDLAAMVGYQLFAVSCITSQKKSEVKEHLLEVYVRARQLGGDEARVALVCSFDRPEFLEIEIARAWDAKGRVRVFGRRHLKDLTEHFEQWFETANK